MSNPTAAPSSERRILWRAIAISLLPAILLVLFSWNAYPADFSALYFAAEFYAQADWANVYPRTPEFFWDPVPEAWQERAAHAGGDPANAPSIVTPYVYPPLWAAVLAPLTQIFSFSVTGNLLVVVNALALVAMIWMGKALFPSQAHSSFNWAALCAGLTAFSIVFQLAFLLGQPQIIVTAMIMGSVLLLAQGHDKSAGALLALAAAIKLAPAIFAVLFVMERRWRALGSFMVVGAGLAAASVLIAGWPLHEGFLYKLSQLDGRTLLSRINLSLDQPIYHLHHLVNGTFVSAYYKPELLEAPRWGAIALRLMFLAGLWWVYQATRTLPDQQRLGQRLLSLSLLVILTSPLGWLHYMLLPLMLLPGLSGTRGFWVLYPLCVLVFMPQWFLWLTDHKFGFFVLPGLYCTTAVAILLISLRKGDRLART